MLQRTRESLVLILIIFLPLHALLVTGGTRVLLGAGHPPLPMLAMWKEGILLIILCVAVLELIRKFSIFNFQFSIDILDWLVLGLVALGVIIPSENFVYGFKYTLFPLCLFLVLRRVSWSEGFRQNVWNAILVVGGVVAGYGVIAFFLPLEFFTWLGYSDLHSLYLPDGPLAAFQQVGGTGLRRIQSTFSGPNQFGMWLLIPLSVLISSWMRKFPSPGLRLRGSDSRSGGLGSRRGDMSNDEFHLFSDPLPTRRVPFGAALSLWERGKLMFLILFVLALFLTFSRAAWIGAIVMVLFFIYRNRVSKNTAAHSDVPAFAEATAGKRIAAALGGIVVVIGVIAFWNPDVLIRSFSSRGHVERPIAAIQTIIAHPLGLGLGSAGPASNRVSDPCVYLEEGSDTAWAKDRQNLCVFAGGNQVQPVDRICTCPFLPENWYLQVGVELGVLGLLLFVSLTLLLLRRLILHFTFYILHSSVFLSFLGISISALFLHSWEDAAVAYTVWILVAMMLPCTKGAPVLSTDEVSWSSTLGASTRT